jgi:zinc transporter ZupT
MSLLPKSLLPQNTSVMLGVANGALIVSIYDKMIPSVASVRVSQDTNDKDVEAARKHAAWASAGVLGFMYLLTRDKNSFLIGGLVLAGVDIMVKHANGYNPQTQSLDSNDDLSIDPSLVSDYSLENYDDQTAANEMGVQY